MNSYIKLKNGMIINLSQIEAIGPFMPYSETVQGILSKSDQEDDLEEALDIAVIIEGNEQITKNTFCVPANSRHNIGAYDSIDDESCTIQQYMMLLKSGRIILLTQEEYDNICEVMDFNNNYSNIDYKYSKFS